MTTEEKARAYDEALTTAKRIISENCSEVEKLCLKCVFPELRESEDERIRKALVEYFAPPVSFTTVRGIPVQKVRDWLEKQKDLTTENIYKHSRERMSFWNGQQKEQKPVDLSEMMVHKEPYIAPVPTPMVADEQKPAECIDFYDEFYKVYTGPKNILAYVNIFVKKLGYVPIDIHELSACVYYVIKHIEEDTKASQKEQKPSEWSEEDEMYLSQAIETLEHECYSCLADKLKSLRPQPKCEIYKSAKHDFAIRFMNYLDENRPKGKMSLSNDECEDIDKAFRENDWAKILMYAEKYGKKN